jgi:hypothetical protein
MLGDTTIWVLITFVGVAVAIAVAFGFIKLFGLLVGSVDSKAYDALPTWLLLVVIICGIRMIFPPDAPQAPLCVESKRDTIVRCEAKLGNHR